MVCHLLPFLLILRKKIFDCNDSYSIVAGTSADEAASDSNDDDSEAALVKQSPSVADDSLNCTTSPHGSGKPRPQQKKKRYADITIIDIDIDTDAERMTRSMAKALALPPTPPSPKKVRFNLPTPRRINRRRKTFAV